jgi:hypothetical protein
MQTTLNKRKEMISQLVECSVASAISESPQYWLREIFENGFVGYRQLSDQQLDMEIQLRGLGKPAELADQDDADTDDEFSFSLVHI